MKKIRTRFYQWQANQIIKAMSKVSGEMVEVLYYIGTNLNDKAIRKGIWLN
jgi:hypothetical protein